ncbi:MAG: hypothetical protein IRY84_12855 [Thermobispora bispora]|nr:hypothetical protein [Thermobispora bispora]
MLVHDVGVIVTTVLFTPVLAAAFYFALIGALRDWDDEHRERLRDYTSRRAGSGNLPRHIVEGVASPSPAVRAQAYQAFIRQFTGLDDRDGTDRDNGRR